MCEGKVSTNKIFKKVIFWKEILQYIVQGINLHCAWRALAKDNSTERKKNMNNSQKKHKWDSFL